MQYFIKLFNVVKKLTLKTKEIASVVFQISKFSRGSIQKNNKNFTLGPQYSPWAWQMFAASKRIAAFAAMQIQPL